MAKRLFSFLVILYLIPILSFAQTRCNNNDLKEYGLSGKVKEVELKGHMAIDK
jgi:hypothetical protein